MASNTLSVSGQCHHCHGTKHTTSQGKLLCALSTHRMKMRCVREVIWRHGHEDELETLTVEETGNAGYYLEHIEEFDVIVEDMEKLERQRRLAEKGAEVRFMQAIKGVLKLQKVNAELAEVMTENAELRRRLAALEAQAPLQ